MLFVFAACGDDDDSGTNPNNDTNKATNGKIAFTDLGDGNYESYEIYIMDVDGGNKKKLTNNNVTDQCPQWSPDGSKIIFERYDESGDLYVMDSDGQNLQNLTNSSNGEKCVDWQVIMP